MNNYIWDKFYWNNTDSNTSSIGSATNSSSSVFENKYKSQFIKTCADIQEQRMQKQKIIHERLHICDLKSVKLPDCNQRMSVDLDLDFTRQIKNRDVLEPQTIFHFDAKDIDKEWPKKNSYKRRKFINDR